LTSTLIHGEVIDLLAAKVGAHKQIRNITAAAMRGALDFVCGTSTACSHSSRTAIGEVPKTSGPLLVRAPRSEPP
jgi:phosphoserine phosphatase